LTVSRTAGGGHESPSSEKIRFDRGYRPYMAFMRADCKYPSGSGAAMLKARI
jgi:hypothetical protein